MKKNVNTDKTITAEEFDKLADSGPDEIDPHLDWDNVSRPGLEIKRVSIDLPAYMLARLDEESALRGITRQSLIKVWLFDCLEAAAKIEKPNTGETQMLLAIAVKNPREAIKQSWNALAKTVLRIAKVRGENLNPCAEEINNSLKRLNSDVDVANDLVLQITELRATANMAINQSEWAFNPPVEKAQEFICLAAVTRSDLGEMVG